MLDRYGIIYVLRLITSASRLTTLTPCYTIRKPALLARDESQQPSRRNGAGFVLLSEDDMTKVAKVCPVCLQTFFLSPSMADKRTLCSMKCRCNTTARFWGYPDLVVEYSLGT